MKSPFFLLLIFCLLLIGSCKKEETVQVLKDHYEPKIGEVESTNEDFFVSLTARALQIGEWGSWKIISGNIVKDYVFLENAASPFSKFKGIPGEQYTLEWTRWAADGSKATVQTKVTIPNINIDMQDQTPSAFQTVRTLTVNPKYRGKWTVEPAYGHMRSYYHDGWAEPPELKPSIQVHGYANTTYMATYTHVYAGKTFVFHKTFNTGDYQEDEALFVLNLERKHYRVTLDNSGKVIEINLSSSGIASAFEQPEVVPSLRALKNLRKLQLGGSNLANIPPLFADSFLALEELSMDGMGGTPIFPENFGNLVNLQSFVYRPSRPVDQTKVVVLPKSFANLKALESFKVTGAGIINFNGTLGSLKKLKTLHTTLLSIPQDFGNLEDLDYLEVQVRSNVLPESFSQCKSLRFARLQFDDLATNELTLPADLGMLKKLETFEITSGKLLHLPNSMDGLTSLRNLTLNTWNLQSIPTNFGGMSNLESLTVIGKFNVVPESFGNLTKLVYLTLSGNAQTLPESFGNLSSLIYFNGESSALRRLPSTFGKLKRLQQIALRYSKIEELPANFGELDALEKLDLSGTQISTFPKSLIKLQSINFIYLGSTNSGNIPDEITQMKTQVTFYLTDVPNLTFDHIKHIASIVKGMVFHTNFGYIASTN